MFDLILKGDLSGRSQPRGFICAPNETLDFSTIENVVRQDADTGVALRMSNLSNKKAKLLKEKISQLRDGLPPKKAGLVNPVKEPRIDDVYFDGVAWLESLSGDKF